MIGIVSNINYVFKNAQSVILTPVTHTIGLIGEVAASSLIKNKQVQHTPLEWINLSFETPSGDSNTPLALELIGTNDAPILGKGAIWVNGIMLGRYWNITANSALSCDEACLTNQMTYVGSYNADRCTTGCNQPSQKYYKLPYDWLHTDGTVNSVRIMEELGGNPENIRLNVVKMKSY